MEADWEVEIGGGAPVIEALWPGFIDLRSRPERMGEIQEAGEFVALGNLLLALNAHGSPLWTSKCDLWRPASSGEESSLACYIDLLPRASIVFASWEEAERLCRRWVERLCLGNAPGCSFELVVRQAVAGALEGFGITAYLAGEGTDPASAADALAAGMVAFADAAGSVKLP